MKRLDNVQYSEVTSIVEMMNAISLCKDYVLSNTYLKKNERFNMYFVMVTVLKALYLELKGGGFEPYCKSEYKYNAMIDDTYLFVSIDRGDEK